MPVFDYFPETTVHFSKSLGTSLFMENGPRLGQLIDFFVDYEEPYPQVLALQFKQKQMRFYVHWQDIKTFSYKKVVIKREAHIRRGATFPKVNQKKIITSLLGNELTERVVDYPPVGKVILDRQIVDTNGKKVVRVNDINFIKIGQILRVTHAEVGLRSMVRRLGFENFIDPIVKSLKSNSQYLSKETAISWKYVHAVPDKSISSNVKLNLSNEEIGKLHPADLADILEDLDSYGREQIFQKLTPDKKAKTLSEIESEIQTSLIVNQDPREAAKIIESMDTDDAADILHDMDHGQIEEILANIQDDEIQEEIQELLIYEEDTAGGLMTTEYLAVTKDRTRDQILNEIKENHEDITSLNDIYIIDEEETLIGHCPLRQLLIQRENLQVQDFMRTEDIKFCNQDDSWKEVASMMSKYNLFNIPVADGNHKLRGVVAVDDILPWLLDER